MTVYVDDMKADFAPSHRPGRKYILSHMIADTEEELHAMADKIGVLGSLIPKADVVLVGGRMAFTFLAAQVRGD